MSSVDKRVVEMQFNNKQFEKDMATTVKSLKNFEKNLELKDGQKGLEGFEKRLKSVEAKANNIDFNKLYNSIEGIKNKFTLLGTIAFSTVQKLTQDTVDKVVGGLNKIYDTIMVKGQTRAINLEQANFKLMGLLKNEEKVAQVMEDVDYAVSGTAYGLDAAAGVAAQLAASNIQAGDEMKTALRGISGVAAMTSSSYEEIGAVFARVAGQGRVMATDLNSLAARGMNAAATLGDFLGVTESQVREMVSEGVIDFKTFATAMNEAFGEQSKKANETFTGAMSNVQAALGRVGAGFKQPYIKYMRPVLVQLIQNINAVKDAFGPLYDTTSFVFKKLSDFAITVLAPMIGVRKEGDKQIKTITVLRNIFSNLHETVTKNWEQIARLINTVTHLFWKFSDTLRPITSILTFLIKDLFGELMGLSWGLKDIYKSGNFLYNVLDEIKSILSVVYRWFVTSWPNIKSILSSTFTIIKTIFNLVVRIVRPIKDALFSVLSFEEITKILADLVSAVSGVFKAIGEAFEESSDGGNALYEILTFIFSIFKIGIKIIGQVLGLITKGIRFLTPYIKILTSIAVKIGDIIFQLLRLGTGKVSEGIQFLIDKFKSFEGPLANVKEWFVNAKTWIVDKFTNYTTAASQGLDWLKSRLTGSKKEFEKTGDSAEKSGNKIVEFRDKVKNATSSMVESIKANPIVQAVIEKVKSFFSFIWTGIKNIANQVKTNFSKAFESVTQRGVTTTVFDWLRSAVKMIGELARDLIDNLGPVKDSLLKLTGTDSLTDLVQRIISIFVSIKMADFFKSFAKFHDSLATLPKTISDFINAIKKPFDTLDKNFKENKSSALKNFAISATLLAVALLILSRIPKRRLQDVTIFFGLFMAAILSFVMIYEKITSKIQNIARNMTSLALVIYAFEKAVTKIILSMSILMLVVNAVKPSSVLLSILVVGAITSLIGTFAILFAKFAKSNMRPTQIMSYSILIKAMASAIKGIALMIAILSLPIFKPANVAVATTCIAGITIIVGALLALFISKGSAFGNKPTQILAFSLMIKAFGSAIKGIALMIAILSLPIFNPGRLWNSVAVIAAIGAVISGLMMVLRLVSSVPSTKIAILTRFVKNMAHALEGIAIVIGILSFLNPGKVWSAVGVIAAIGLIIGGLATLSEKVGGKGLYTVGKSIMFIGVGLLALVTAIKKLSGLSMQAFERVSDGITVIVASAPKWIGMIVVGLIETLNQLGPSIAQSLISLLVSTIQIMTKSAGTIVKAIVSFFQVVVQSLAQYSNAFKIEDLFWAVQSVALIAGLIYVLQVIASDMKSALKGVALMALVLGAIVGSLVIINQFTNPESSIGILKGIAETVLSLAGIFAVIVAATAVLGKMDAKKQAITLGIAIGGFLTLIITLALTMSFVGWLFTDVLKDGIQNLTVAIEVLGMIGQAFGNLFGSFVKTFSDVVNQAQNAENITKVLVPVLLAITPLLLGLSLLFPLLIPLFAAIAAGAAAIMYFDIDTDKLKAAFDTLKELAGLIGGLLGVFIGEIFANMSSGFAKAMETFASGLSSFMEKLQPFLGYLGNISFDTLKKATMLTGIILELAAGEIVAAIATFIDAMAGGATLVKLGVYYSAFMVASKRFFKEIGELSDKDLRNALLMSKIITNMAGAQIISSISNWFRVFGGGNPLKDLADQLAKAAPSMVEFSNILSNGMFNGDLTLKASECILMMARVANLMREGGLLQKIIGNPKNLADFAGELTTLGGNLVQFSGSINELTEQDLNNIKTTIPIIESLIKIAEAMPRENGVFQWVIGNLRDLGTFGTDLKNFGSGMLGFAVSLEGMTQDHVDRFKLVEPMITSLVNIAKSLPKEKGYWQLLTGQTESMTEFVIDLIYFSIGFVGVAQKLNEISPQELANLDRLKPIIQGLANVAAVLKTTGIGIETIFGSFSFEQNYDLENFGKSLEGLGEGLTKYAAATNAISKQNAINASNGKDILVGLTPVLNELKTNKETWLWYTKETSWDFSSLGESLGQLGTGIATFAQNTAGIGDIKNSETIGKTIKLFAESIVLMKDIDPNGSVNFISALTNINSNINKLKAVAGIFGDNNYQVQKSFERTVAVANSVMALSNAFSNAAGISNPEGFFTALYNLAYGFKNQENSHEINDLLKVSYLLGENNYNVQEAYKRIKTIVACINELSSSLKFDNQTDFDGFQNKFLPAITKLSESNLSSILNIFGENADLDTIKEKTKTISGILVDFMEAFKHVDANKVTDVEDFSAAVNDLATTLTADLALKINENAIKVTEAISNLVTAINNKLKEKPAGLDDATKTLMDNVNTSMVSHSNIVVNGFGTVIKKCIDSLKSYTTVDSEGKLYTFYNAGADAVAGYAKGIESNIQKAIDAGVLIGQKSLEGAKSQKALNEHSPSKAFGEVADFAVLGFVNRFISMASMAFTAGQNLGNSAMEGTKSIVANISDIINSDMNLQPVIRPVLDLSDINSQSGLIGGILNAGGSYQLAGRTAALIEQNRTDRRNARINQNGSRDIVDSVNNLTSRMDSLEQAILNRPIVMDGVKVTKQIAPSMDKELGQRRYYSRRGN